MNVNVVCWSKELQYALQADLSCRGFVGDGIKVWLIDGGLLESPELRSLVEAHREHCALLSCAADYYHPLADRLGLVHILLPEEWDKLLAWLSLWAEKEARQ